MDRFSGEMDAKTMSNSCFYIITTTIQPSLISANVFNIVTENIFLLILLNEFEGIHLDNFLQENRRLPYLKHLACCIKYCTWFSAFIQEL